MRTSARTVLASTATACTTCGSAADTVASKTSSTVRTGRCVNIAAGRWIQICPEGGHQVVGKCDVKKRRVAVGVTVGPEGQVAVGSHRDRALDLVVEDERKGQRNDGGVIISQAERGSRGRDVDDRIGAGNRKQVGACVSQTIVLQVGLQEVRDVDAVDPVSLIAYDKVMVTVDAVKKFEEMLA